MEQRKLGRTGQMSSLLTLGGAALRSSSQSEADAAIELAVSHGVNHFDVAPVYGQAEVLLSSWLERNRSTVFLGCKTMTRDKEGTWESINRSLERLKTDHFDLFQFHSVDDLETLSVILGPGGALEAVAEAREQGLVRHIGITGHRPYVQVEALNRFDFDTVMCPLSRLHRAHLNDFNNYIPLIKAARRKDAGVITIKAMAKRAWSRLTHVYGTWYEPFDRLEDIEKSLWFTLSQDITTTTLPGDIKLWPAVIDAAERFNPLSRQQQDEAVSEMAPYQPISTPA
jgi:aryl-alcohol dehydrogenase-like predicted oxidoreductase